MKDWVTVVTGLIGNGIAILFLGWLAVSISSIPLYIIIGGCIALMAADFTLAMRRGEYRG